MPVLDFIVNYIIPFLVILTVLVFVHEMGHYAVARWNKVRVEVFSIGFGRELFGWTDRAGTRWKFSAIPLGGYVKMFGDANAASAGGDGLDTMSPAERAVSFHHKRVGQRAAIVFAGPFINYVFAVLVLALLFIFAGQPFTPPKVGTVVPGGAAAAAGLRPGDRIVSVEGRSIERFEQVAQLVRLHPEDRLAFVIERAGRRFSLTITPTRSVQTDRWKNKHVLGSIGINPYSPAEVRRVQPNSAAAAAGIKPGDRIVEVAGEKVLSFEQMAKIIRASPGKEISVVVIRAGRRLALRATPKPIEIKTKDKPTVVIGQLGVTRRLVDYAKHGPATAVWQAVKETVSMTRATFTAIGQMIEGSRSTKDLGGPLRIGEMAGQMAQLGFGEYIWFMGILSLHLCLINFFPIPMLDGGHLVFYAYEAIRGKPLGERAQEYGFRIGLALVLTLMLFVTWNDIVHLTDKMGLFR